MAKKPLDEAGRAKLKAMSDKVKERKRANLEAFDPTGYEQVSQYQFYKLIGGHRADVYPTSGTVSFRNETTKGVNIPEFIAGLEAKVASGEIQAK